MTLLRERYELMAREREQAIQQMQAMRVLNEAHRLVHNQKLTLLGAERNWLARTILHLQTGRVQSRAGALIRRIHHSRLL